VAGGQVDGITPQAASRGAADWIPDQRLPLLAAQWLADGLDSPELRDLAGLGRRDGVEARRMLPGVLASLGHPVCGYDNPYDQAAWRGYWGGLAWARYAMDDRLTPYAAAQHVIEIAGDVPDLWQPAGGAALQALLTDWDRNPQLRPGIDDAIRAHLNALNEDDVPPLADKPRNP
jgi:hypothetical protein